MAKGKVSASEMAARLMGAGVSSGNKPAHSGKQDPASPDAGMPPVREIAAKKEDGEGRRKIRAKDTGTKRLNLNITIQQWRKLKGYAMDRGVSASDVIRDCIDAL